jgi:UDP-galactopyranose mutase
VRSDYLIVGSGLTGAVLARQLVDAGRNVVVVDRRSHPGGNVHDHTHVSGIRIHTYGPHYFRTNSREIWDFVNRFAKFYPFEAVVKSLVDGRPENWPIAASYIRGMVGSTWEPEFKGTPGNFEEASLALMPRVIYEKFVKGYSEKQWGVPASALSAGLAKRFDVRPDDEPRLMRHTYQGLPLDGYAALMQNMLAGIPVILNCDYLRHQAAFDCKRLLIYTGPIDELFQYEFGKLKYRGQQRTHEYLPDVEFAQCCGQINNPEPVPGSHIRTLEWKHMMPKEYASRIRGTVLTRETTVSPENPNEYEYPFPDQANAMIFKKYCERAKSLPNTLVCGRLGEYRYYDMDQAIGRAFYLSQKILIGRSLSEEEKSGGS